MSLAIISLQGVRRPIVPGFLEVHPSMLASAENPCACLIHPFGHSRIRGYYKGLDQEVPPNGIHTIVFAESLL